MKDIDRIRREFKMLERFNRVLVPEPGSDIVFHIGHIEFVAIWHDYYREEGNG